MRSDNYFALERLQKQSLWRRDGKRTLAKKDGKRAKNFPSSPSCPPPEFCSSDGFCSRTVSNNYFLAQKNRKEICPTLIFLMNLVKGKNQHCLIRRFHPKRRKIYLSAVVCDDDSCCCVGKVLSKTNLLVN